ncbi:N-acetylglucosaminyl-phosphatidylinositol biosynthetic protein gpi1-like isoform X1 [Zingiber officinale]|uniref:N-acetylglucosaminyl-phosphatidylinositol biosynthetic protein gpi1-like isoform X1 n=1 Tax=Zingiber officinale TaxID=94328 RepID=UPI001C4D158B|nr:N-acetylglucosaminyl-phosphatidylinositol biosynthetic protein gpi1-like isoform X1 [Zingiber officinale]XP_042457511.1 N-acetylglucosaminyl-phosphatidylinositol biosynthetic protein gpi1-like isoform X1 [Zingiber officinale]
MKMGGRNYRVWWPQQLLTSTSSSGLFLFGWFMDSVDSIDIVIAAAISSAKILTHPFQTNLEEILVSANQKMPLRLESFTFSLLGYCLTDGGKLRPVCSQNGGLPFRKQFNDECYKELKACQNNGKWHCDCMNFIEPYFLSSLGCNNWIFMLLCKPQRILYKRNQQIPYLHHVHHNGDIVTPVDFHIIVYEVPTFGVSHVSMSSWHAPENIDLLSKKPKWVKEIYKKPVVDNFETVLLALNCSNSAKTFLEQVENTLSPMTGIFFVSKMLRVAFIIWHMVAAIVASISTIIYIFLQFLHKPLTHGSIWFILSKIFTHTSKNVHIRSCQFLYWPVTLQAPGTSISHSSVEYSHKAALRKHFIWSNVLMDVTLGIVLGILLLANSETICSWISVIVHQITNDLLRSGSVWLMGVPAGFKLNNEQAEFIGIISLNTIQIFSTLWSFIDVFLRYYILVLALLGIVFGLTIPVALCIDILKLATFHICILHHMISFLYSQQIQALASLWRLFRGQKRNPLRQRLDSYDYTVEQHVVGSLLFTPLLLLIPTTSVFYIFLTSLITTIIFLSIIFEIIISMLHATPYAEVWIWIMSRRKFPSGIWFEVLDFGNGITDEFYSQPCFDGRQGDSFGGGESGFLVSQLCCNYATIGQVILPCYIGVFNGVTPSFFTSLAHGLLSGQRFPSTLGTRLPSTMPWMQITCKEYWKLCYTAVLSCRL